MTIAQEIIALNNNLTAAKNAVTTKGGTVGNTGLSGLATEIASIPSGGQSAPEYLRFKFYSYNDEWKINYTNYCTATITDQESLDLLMTDIGDMEDVNVHDKNATFHLFYNSAEEGWYLRINDTEVPIYLEDCMDITIPDPSLYVYIELAWRTVADTSENTLNTLDVSASAFNKLAVDNDTNRNYVGLPAIAIKEAIIGTNAQSLPHYFLINADNLTTVDFSNASSLTSIGNNFCGGCPSLTTVDFSNASSLTTIGGSCCQRCQALTTVALPSSITSLGGNFLNTTPNLATVNVGSLSASVASTTGYSFSQLSSTVPSFSVGVKIEGSTAYDWVARFPYSTSPYYRNLYTQNNTTEEMPFE